MASVTHTPIPWFLSLRLDELAEWESAAAKMQEG